MKIQSNSDEPISLYLHGSHLMEPSSILLCCRSIELQCWGCCREWSMVQGLTMLDICSSLTGCGTASWEGSNSRKGSAPISCLWVACWSQPPLAHMLQSQQMIKPMCSVAVPLNMLPYNSRFRKQNGTRARIMYGQPASTAT